MAYATVQDLIDRFDEMTLQQVTSTDGLSIDQTAIERAVADASDAIDGYLQSRYELPLASPPPILKLHTCNMAFYQLLSARPSGDLEDVRKRYDDALRFLEKVAKGDVSLGLADDDSAPAEIEGPRFRAPDRKFGRANLGGF